LKERTIEESITVGNQWLELSIDLADRINPCRIIDTCEGVAYADEAYSYSMEIRTADQVAPSRGLTYRSHQVNDRGIEGTEVVLEGSLEFDEGGPRDIFVRQRFRIPRNEPFFEEQITILNKGAVRLDVSDISFGFRKKTFDRQESKWADEFEDFRLVPVPHRRRFGHRVDRKLSEYELRDLLPGTWEDSTIVPGGHPLPDHGSEGWVWTDGERGLLVVKYLRDQIEFSILKGEIVQSNPCVRFGGVGLWREDPEFAHQILPHSDLEFGVTRYELIQGGWKEGYYAFRDYMSSLGHTFPEDYDPPVHWNELYNLGWSLGDGSSRYTLDQTYREAEIAAEMGCESLYLDPGWDTLEGSTIWDEQRLGITLPSFVKEIRERYGLGVSLHLMMHTNSKQEYEGMYRRDAEGRLVTVWDGAKVCTQSKWKEEKARRLLALAKAGVGFLMFDFLEQTPSCYDRSHGHEVPLTRQGHAEGILELIQSVKKSSPQIYIEAHDRITAGFQDYHPSYFQHGAPHSFDENWGFEYMWDSYLDLISGKAISLYEYNLAYEIPLYLHINIGKETGLQGGETPVGPDSPNMLAFWWYASTVRHLGIGGVNDPDSTLYKALKKAMKEYMSLQDFFKRGKFYGIDEYTHVHTLPERNQAVISLFNLTGKDTVRQVGAALGDIGLGSFSKLTGVDGYQGDNEGFSFNITMRPMSPALVKVNM